MTARPTTYATKLSALRCMAWCFFACFAGIAAIGITSGTAHAQAGLTRTGYINPFPQGDVYRVHLVGDWYADGLHGAVAQALGANPRLQVQTRIIQVRSLRRSDWDEQVSEIEARAKAAPIDIAIVMFGAAEIGSISMPGSRRIRFGQDAWQSQYAARLDRIMKALKISNGAVYWLGLPVVSRSNFDEGYQAINEIFRGRTYVNGIKYIDVYKGFANEDGEFTPYGPDVNGKVQLLRNRDGNYFTAAGYQKLAHFAVREITRDLVRAQSERNVPLAGSEVEQRRINPERFKQQPVPGSDPSTDRPAPKVRLGKADREARPQPPRTGPLRLGRQNRELEADDGSVEIVTGPIGQRHGGVLKLKIVRPAISAAVIDLVTRKQSAEQPASMGDSVTLQLPGGGTLMSSVTPASAANLADRRAKLSPTQSPFFKVWAKGERLPPKPGRADDYDWPRPEPLPVVRVSDQRAGPGRTGEAQADSGMPPLPEPNPFGAAAHRWRR
jgi:uncharacterized protein